jgi:hypothetical protein
LCTAADGTEKRPVSTSDPIVVELFTSEGCSSCPPADELLGELASRPHIIALGFHVDYWDDIGWRDRYSMPAATQRQRRYVEALNLSSAFTPQIIVNGRGSFVGSDRKRIDAALSLPVAGIPVELTADHGVLSVTLPDADDHRSYVVDLAAYLPQATTRIGRGENSGKTLTEFNIVRQLRRLGEWRGKSTTFLVSLDALPDDVTRAAVLVQLGDGGPIVGAGSAILR